MIIYYFLLILIKRSHRWQDDNLGNESNGAINKRVIWREEAKVLFRSLPYQLHPYLIVLFYHFWLPYQNINDIWIINFFYYHHSSQFSTVLHQTSLFWHWHVVHLSMFHVCPVALRSPFANTHSSVIFFSNECRRVFLRLLPLTVRSSPCGGDLPLTVPSSPCGDEWEGIEKSPCGGEWESIDEHPLSQHDCQTLRFSRGKIEHGR